ncbi:MAG: VTC domain-containing protein [Myxococcota bacterium]
MKPRQLTSPSVMPDQDAKPAATQLTFERLELKFLIDEVVADRIRDEIGAVCAADRHSRAGRRAGSNGYTINSLYLDTPGLAFHHAKERGDPDRVKLRVRTYSPDSLATLEVKRRRSNVIEKRRAVVRREDVPNAVRGVIDSDQMDGKGDKALQEFAYIVATSGALPKLSVRYEREAYESQVDPYARVTFDRNIRIQPASTWDLFPAEHGWSHFDDFWRLNLPTHPIVLELKCETAKIPCWMTDVIRRNQLEQTSFSKYSIGTCISHWLQGSDVSSARSLGALG